MKKTNKIYEVLLYLLTSGAVVMLTWLVLFSNGQSLNTTPKTAPINKTYQAPFNVVEMTENPLDRVYISDDVTDVDNLIGMSANERCEKDHSEQRELGIISYEVTRI